MLIIVVISVILAGGGLGLYYYNFLRDETSDSQSNNPSSCGNFNPVGDPPVIGSSSFIGGTPPLQKPMVALTFDDGPSVHTDRLLDILERYNASASFFVLGSLIALRPDTVVRAAHSGHEVVGHAWTHHNLTRLSRPDIAAQIQDTSDTIKAVTGISPPLYRPPYGSINSNVREVSAELGYSIAHWTLDPLDWYYRNADRIYNTIMSQVEDGSVIVLHDIHPTTVDAMERVIPSLIEQGYQLVTMSTLLYHFYGGLEPGFVYGIDCLD